MLYVAEPLLRYRRGGARTRPIQHITEEQIQKTLQCCSVFLFHFLQKKPDEEKRPLVKNAGLDRSINLLKFSQCFIAAIFFNIYYYITNFRVSL